MSIGTYRDHRTCLLRKYPSFRLVFRANNRGLHGQKTCGVQKSSFSYEDILLLDCRKADKQLEDSTDLILHGGDNSFFMFDSFPCYRIT